MMNMMTMTIYVKLIKAVDHLQWIHIKTIQNKTFIDLL